MNIHRIIKNELPGYYHLICYLAHEKLGFEELQEEFAKLGFTGYEWLQYGRQYVMHFSDAATEAQFLLYFNDIIKEDMKTLNDLTKFVLIESH